MVTYHFRQGMKEKLKRRFFFLFFLLGIFMYHLFDMIGDIVRMFCSFEDEIVLVSGSVEYDISFVKERIPKWVALNRRTFYVVIIYENNVPCEDIPIYIHHSVIRYEPDIVIPVKYLVYEEKIERDRIYLEVEKWDERLYREWIVIVEKGRKGKSHKKCHDNPIYDENGMSMAYKNKLLIIPKILLKKNLVKIIHKQNMICIL